MRKYTIAFMLIVAACFGCGGNNPVPTIGMNQSGTRADAILSTNNNFTFTRTVNTNLGRNKHSENLEKFTKEVITQEDDFLSDEIISPAKEFDVPKEHYQLNAQSGGSFTYDRTGSTVSIPPDALVDKDGNQVTGQVDISYREFHTQKEIFFSGIPMDFDVNGEKQFFESAGMIDISASQNGEEVFVKKGSTISFNMSTDNQNEEVKLYELDKKTKKWSELGNAPVIQTPYRPKKRWGPVYKTEINNDISRTPIRIYIRDYQSYRDPLTKEPVYKLKFSMEVTQRNFKDKKEYREDYKKASMFNRTLFEISGIKKSQFKKMMKAVGWKRHSKDQNNYYYGTRADVNITNTNNPSMTIEFTRNGQSAIFDVKVVHQNPKSTRNKKKWFDAVSSFPINEFVGRYNDKRMTTSCIDRWDSISNSYQDWENKYLVQREFSTKNFGVINCDQPHKMPDERIANASFFVDGKPVHPNFAVLVDFKQKCQFSYYQYAFNKFGYNPDVKNFIFTVLDDGTVAFIMPDEFKALKNEKNLEIPLHRVSMENFSQVMEDLFPSKKHREYET